MNLFPFLQCLKGWQRCARVGNASLLWGRKEGSHRVIPRFCAEVDVPLLSGTSHWWGSMAQSVSALYILWGSDLDKYYFVSKREKRSTGFYSLEQALHCIWQLRNKNLLGKFMFKKVVSDETLLILGCKGLFTSVSSLLPWGGVYLAAYLLLSSLLCQKITFPQSTE